MTWVRVRVVRERMRFDEPAGLYICPSLVRSDGVRFPEPTRWLRVAI